MAYFLGSVDRSVGNLGASAGRRQTNAVDRIEATSEGTSIVKGRSVFGFRLRHLRQLGHLAHGDTNRHVAESGKVVGKYFGILVLLLAASIGLMVGEVAGWL